MIDLLIDTCSDENGEHEEGNRMKDDGEVIYMDLGLCNIHPVRIRPGTLYEVVMDGVTQTRLDWIARHEVRKRRLIVLRHVDEVYD